VASVLIVAKGHDYDQTAFNAMFRAMRNVRTTLVEQPAAQIILQPEHVGTYDCVLFYDMTGLTGQPPDAYRDAVEALTDRGVGIVMLNHATVSWPDWPLWREISGTSFMVRRGEFDGEEVPGSGYRGGHGPLPNAEFRLRAVGEHPVLAGLEQGFAITDELYLKTPGFEHRVLPLMRAEYAFVRANFSPPPLADGAEQASWDHPPGSDLVVWANAARNSPVVASDLGDGPAAFANPGFRRLLENALKWVSSAQARAWAATRPRV
jgi:hypothetical protein